MPLDQLNAINTLFITIAIEGGGHNHTARVTNAQRFAFLSLCILRHTFLKKEIIKKNAQKKRSSVFFSLNF